MAIVLTALLLGSVGALLDLAVGSGYQAGIDAMQRAVRCHSRCDGPDKALTCGVFDEDSEHPGVEYSVCVNADTGHAGIDSRLVLDRDQYGKSLKMEIFIFPDDSEEGEDIDEEDDTDGAPNQEEKPESVYL